MSIYDDAVDEVSSTPAAAPKTSIYDDAVDEVTQSAADALHSSMYNATLTDPVLEAKKRAAAATLGVDKGSITDVQRAEVEATLKSLNVDEIAKKSPKTAEFLRERDNANVAWKDAGVLSRMEQVIRGAMGSSFIASNQAWRGIQQRYQDAHPDIYGKADEARAQADFRFSQQAQEDLAPKIESSLGQKAYAGFEGLVDTVPALLATALNPLAGAAIFGAQAQAQSYGKYRARGGTVEEARLGSNLEGGIAAATSAIPLGYVADKFGKEGAKKFVANLLVRDFGAMEAQSLATSAVDTAIANPDKTFSDWVKEIPDQTVQAAVSTALFTGTLGSGHAIARHLAKPMEQQAKADSTQRDMEAITSLSALAQVAEVRKNAPEVFNQFVQKMTEDGHLTDVYVPAEKLAEALKTNDMGGELSQSIPDLKKQLPEALALKGDVRISVADYATHIAGHPIEKSILNDMKTSPDGMTYAQMEEHQAQEVQRMSQVAEDVVNTLATNAEQKADAYSVESAISAKLKATGMFSHDVVNSYAKIAAATYVQAAHREGVTAMEAFAKRPFDVQSVLEGESTKGYYNQSGPLIGLPASSIGPNQNIRAIAEKYMSERGIARSSQTEYFLADPVKGAEIAQAYEDMQHNPEDPETQKAYKAMVDETIAQYHALKDLGFVFEMVPKGAPDPYAEGSKKALTDMKDNKHLWVFPTESGFGKEGETSKGNPLLEKTGIMLGDHELLANDVFRIVHDVFGHGKEGVPFGPNGEENAWQSHVRMYSPAAARAMTTETRGQNSWVNFGPYGESNRANPKNTTYATQKTGLLPEWVSRHVVGEPNVFEQNQVGQVAIIGVHYSKEQRPVLSGSYHGTGIKGAEGERVRTAEDPRIKKRLYFYVDEGKGTFPESGGGDKTHTVTLTNMYDGARNPLKLGRNDEGFDFNRFESEVLDKGFDGYYVKDGYGRQGSAVLLGDAARAVHPDKAANINERAAAFLEHKLQDFETSFKEYASRPDALGGKVLNTGVARELSPHFLADRTMSQAVHDAASKFVREAYVRKLQEAPKEGELPEVLFTAGGTGAGKTSAVLSADPEAVNKAQIIYDTNLATFESSVEKVQQALDADKAVSIKLTIRDPLDGLINGALPRAVRQEKEFGSGRTVPVWAHANTYLKSPNTILRIAEHFKDNPLVKVTVIDNGLGKGNAKEVSLAEANKYAYNDKSELEKKLLDAVKGEYEKGNISEAIARGFAHTSEGNRAEYVLDSRKNSGVPENVREANQSAGQRTQQNGEALKGWVRNSQGELLTVYAGVRPSVDASGIEIKNDKYKVGFFTSSDRETASRFGTKVISLNIKLNSPFIVDAKGERYDSIKTPKRLKDFVVASMDTVDTDLIAEYAYKKGFDGAIIKNVLEGSGASRTADDYIVFSKDQIKSAEVSSGAFDVNNPNILAQQARGTYNPATSTIELTKKADLSTFLHELGHHALEMNAFFASHTNASEESKAFFDAIMRNYKVSGDTAEARRAQWNALDVNGKRGVHEQFAQDMETYLFEGKAPNVEMRSVFSKVKAYLMSVYKGTPPSELSDETRQVFDRLFASEEAIKEAQQEAGYAKLFADRPEGVTKDVWDDYTRQAEDATNVAVDTLQARSLKDMKWLSNAKNKTLRMLQREAKAVRDKVGEEVQTEVLNSPTHKAQEFMEEFPRVDKDLVAERFGFQSAREMDEAIRSAGSTRSQIEGLTDKRMLEEHGDLVDERAISSAADQALHSEARAKFMATGLKILTKSSIPVRKLVATAKEVAERTIGEKAIKDIRPAEYQAAEARANKEALQLAPTKPAEAAERQRAAVLNNRLAKTALEANDYVNKGREYLMRFGKDDVLIKMPQEVRDQILSVLDKYDLRKNPTSAPSAQKEALKAWADAMSSNGYSPNIAPEVLAEGRGTHYTNLTLDEFRGVVESIKSMEKIGRQLKTLTVDGERKDLDTVVRTEFLPKFLERGEKYTPEEILVEPSDRISNPVKLLFNRMGTWFNGVLSELKPEAYKRNQYDVHELLGPFGKYIYERIHSANYDKMKRLNNLSKFFMEQGERLGREWQDSLLEKVDNKHLQDPDLGGMMNMTRKQMLGVAFHVGNESNFDKLTKGWNWKPEDVVSFLDEHMTKNDWDAVQTVGDKFAADYPEMEAMVKRLGAIQPDRVEPRPFSTKFGEMAGWYAPISYDVLRSKRGSRQGQAVAMGQTEGLFGGNYYRNDTTTNGSLNSRISNYYDRVDLDYTNIAKTMQQSIHDLAYREAVIDVNKIIEHPEFSRAFKLTYGTEAYAGMRKWLGNTVNSSAQEFGATSIAKAMSYTRTGLVINGIGFRIMTFLKHGSAAGMKSTGYFIGAEKYLLSAAKDMIARPRQMAREGVEKFPELAARKMQQDRDYKELSQSMFEPEAFMDEAHRWGHAGVAFFDFATAVPTAWAAYNRAITEGIPKNKGGTGKPMTEKQAVAYANKIVREAHGTQIETARSLIMNDRSEAIKMMTTLYGFMNNTYGQGVNMVDELRTKGFSKPESLGKGFMALMVPAMMTAYLIDGNPLDDEHGVAFWMAKAVADEVAGSIVGIRDAWKMVEGYRGAGLIGVESSFATLTKPIMDIVKYSQDREVHTAIRDTADTVGTFTHLPGAGQLGATGQYLYNVNSGYENPEDEWDFMEGLVKGHGDK